MSKYTPTTEVVKVRYAIGHGGLSDDVEDARAEDFDRWLAAHDRQVQAEALRAHYRRVSRFMPPGLVDRATVLADLDDYATRLEKGSDDDH